MDGGARQRRPHHGLGARVRCLSRHARRQHGHKPDRHRGAERRRPGRARHGDQYNFKRHDHPSAGQQHRIAGRNRADSGGRADNRPALRGHPAAARRTQGVGTGADVRDVDERARRRADPGARARTGAAETAHAELRHPRHRCRRFPAACRFYPRRGYARGVAQNFAAAGSLRRDPAAGRALRTARRPSAVCQVFRSRQSCGKS